MANPRLLRDGVEVPITLVQDEVWQYQDVALLDFEDGTGACSTNGNSAINTRIVGTVPEPEDGGGVGDDEYQGLVFDLGVPYELNHLDVTAVPSPLNVMAMYWAWAIGHKFVRIDLVTGDGAWNIHLGSQQCDSPEAPSAPPASGCAKPNRPRIALADFRPGEDTVVLDIAALVAGSNLSADAGAPGCQSFPGDVDECTELFPAFGLSFESGDCEDDCAGQSAFSVAAGSSLL